MATNDRHLESLYQATRKVLTREETRAETDVLFDNAGKSRKADRAKMEKLFIQTPGAETMAPNLQKEASVTKNTEAFFEKTAGKSEAQLRYPELLKAAGGTASGPAPMPNMGQPKKATPTSTSGTTPVRSALSGGAS